VCARIEVVDQSPTKACPHGGRLCSDATQEFLGIEDEHEAVTEPSVARVETGTRSQSMDGVHAEDMER
jgi:hypothetical protein